MKSKRDSSDLYVLIATFAFLAALVTLVSDRFGSLQ